MTNTTRKLATLLFGATIIVGLASTDREHRPVAGVRKAVELISEQQGRRLRNAAQAVKVAAA